MTTKPDYIIVEESAAYDEGRLAGRMGRTQEQVEWVTTRREWPNAFMKGYWAGRGERLDEEEGP
jgi:hypothetical protein